MLSDTAFIVGAGAVEGAWDPIISALRNYYDFPLTPDGANSFLARLVYLLRWWSTNTWVGAPMQLRIHKKMLAQIRSDISKSLKKAEERGQIRVRPQFEEIVREHVFADSKSFLLVTTNWDNVVGKALKKLIIKMNIKCQISPLHIHGSALTPNVMYLPTEITKEPYRTNDEEQKIGVLHGDIFRAMEKCDRSVIYGLSISPMDAELGQILACGWDQPHIDEIRIIAPDHKIISHRVNLLLNRKKDVVVKGFDPSNLSAYDDHTIYRNTDIIEKS